MGKYILKQCIICSNPSRYYPHNKSSTGEFCSKKCKGIGTTKNHKIPFIDKYGLKRIGNNFWNISTKSEQQNYIDEMLDKKTIKLPNGCWEWIGNKTKDGYGRITYKGNSIRAHRLIYMFYNNDWNLNSDDFICHTCDFRLCCFIGHLFKGDAKINSLDMHEKGRNLDRKGEKSPTSKLKEIDVKAIKQLLKQKININEIANQYNVSFTTIYDIKENRTWKHIKG